MLSFIYETALHRTNGCRNVATALGARVLYAEGYPHSPNSPVSTGLSVDRNSGGPNVAVAGNLDSPDLTKITVTVGASTVKLSAKLGKYPLQGIQRTFHNLGQVITHLGGAEVVTGAPKATANNYYVPNDNLTVICNGVTPDTVSPGY